MREIVRARSWGTVLIRGDAAAFERESPAEVEVINCSQPAGEVAERLKAAVC